MKKYINAFKWYSLPLKPSDEYPVCSARDLFQTKLDKMYNEMSKQFKNSNQVSLISAIVGELGNNCFDHNLGQWKDVPGCWFDYEVEKNTLWIVISDRGQGIFNSLKRVVLNLKNEQEALELAFHKKISGRSPERRGNGLKFVRNVINDNPRRGLFYSSGMSQIFFGGFGSSALHIISPFLKEKIVGGTFSLILWEIINEG